MLNLEIIGVFFNGFFVLRSCFAFYAVAKNRQKLLKNTQITIQCCKLSISQCTGSLQFKLCSIYFARYFQNPLTRSIITHQNQKIPNFFSIYSEWSRDSVLEKWRVGEQPLMDTTTSTSRLSEAQQQQSVAASAGIYIALK